MDTQGRAGPHSWKSFSSSWSRVLPLASHSPLVLSRLSIASQDPCALPRMPNLRKMSSSKNQGLLP